MTRRGQLHRSAPTVLARFRPEPPRRRSTNLTLGQVPPAAVDSRKPPKALTLVCSDCNSWAGDALGAELSKRDSFVLQGGSWQEPGNFRGCRNDNRLTTVTPPSPASAIS
jgi:hypothetical protein